MLGLRVFTCVLDPGQEPIGATPNSSNPPAEGP